MPGKVENKKLEEHDNENYYLLWWSDKQHFSYNCLGLSDEENSVSDNIFSCTLLPEIETL